MNELFKHLAELIKVGHIDPQDFYVIEIAHGCIRLQGTQDSSKARNYSASFGKGELADSGYIEIVGKSPIDGVTRVKVTLT